MQIQDPVPYVGKSIYSDMISESVSAESRATASRRYIEMIIDLFLSKELKSSVGEEKFYRMSLGERIKGIKPTTSKEVIDTLYRIKDYGDKAAHFNPTIEIKEKDIEKISRDALGIFELILIDYFKKTDFHKTYNTAVIFSTLFPQIRANVLSNLYNNVYIRKQKDREIFHKYIIALVKSNKSNKAKNILKKYKKKGTIDYVIYEMEMQSIKLISEGMNRDKLPIPKVIGDCKRNFEEVLSKISDEEKQENKGLINIINTLLAQYDASEMGDLESNKIYYYSLDNFNNVL
ncbi:MAG: hypothetical protein FH761_09560 [Firmicutes bacterium]|nr:hypothetical protein [Bacillota bacterium]